MPVGGEYPVAGLLRGDQVFPSLSIGEGGGYIVWQDNATDGDGYGISARRLNSDWLGAMGVFRVNAEGAGDQQNAKVKLLKNGGAVFAWQGGPSGEQDIYARFMSKDGTFVTGDVRVNSYVNNQQVNPAIAVLANGNVVFAWSSFGQDGSMQGIFSQVMTPAGEKIGAESQVNQYTAFNQRTPAIAALGNGSYVVAWVSEQKRFENSIDIYGRVFGSEGEPAQGEFLVNASTNICANPVIDLIAGGGFMVGWSQRDTGTLDNGWDVFVRSFSAVGQPAAEPTKVNTHTNGNHYAPQIAAVGDQHMVVWMSAGQDGSREGVFGRFVNSDASAVGSEFQVNTTSASQQIYPTVSSDGAGRFLVAWSSFVGGQTSFDPFAQRYAFSTLTPAAPFVCALSSGRLSITWPDAGSKDVTAYELYIDDNPEPVVVNGNMWTLQSLAPATKHTVKLAYRFSGGGHSAVSAAIIGTTWGSDENLDGLPDDWQSAYWGSDSAKWPEPKMDSDGDGATNLEEFLAGTNPSDSASVLRMQTVATPQGRFLNWNTQPGFVYQLQSRIDLSKSDPAKSDSSREWIDVGLPRFAAGASDSVLIEGASSALYYRVKRLR